MGRHRKVRYDHNAAMRARCYAGIARDLREFGYPDVTASMIEEIHVAYEKGTRPLPHGVVGLMVGRELDKRKESP